MDSGDCKFQSSDEEIRYWKVRYQILCEEKSNLQLEFDDYTTESQQLEKEYEATMEQNEKTITELRLGANRAQNEIELLRARLDEAQRDNNVLQAQLTTAKDERADMHKHIRQLEQKNDDLERAQRMIAETAHAVQDSLNSAIERNAFLESEVDEHELLKERWQRLLDETKELKQDLHVKDRCPDNERQINGFGPNGLHNGIDSNRLRVECETQTTPVKRDIAKNNVGELSLTPSRRIEAMNIIGELLHQVTEMEAKLSQYRSMDPYRDRVESIRRRMPNVKGSSPPLQAQKQ